MLTPKNENVVLTKREYFAAMAMQGILAGDKSYAEDTQWSHILARSAVRFADALIVELEKVEK